MTKFHLFPNYFTFKAKMLGLEEGIDQPEELMLPQSDPLVLELHRLQNLLKEKEKELEAANAEIKALRATQALQTKAVEELESKFNKLDDKLRFRENLLQSKNLEIKKLTDEKKEALAAQFAAEATLRRVHANQRDDDPLPLESVITPLESEIKMYKNEIASLLEDKKAMERLTKSKEAALLETEKILRSALDRAVIVEEIQNQNIELRRQIEICREENKILEKTNRQKVAEVEKLSQTINGLEESLLAGGAAANAVRDYRRQIAELNEDKRSLERELARAKVSANRVAATVANEWKDENYKVMPVKLWLEERRVLQAEIQRLKEKLAISERTAKIEAELKDKFKLRLKTLEEGLQRFSKLSADHPHLPFCTFKPSKSNHILGFIPSNGGLRKRSTSQPRAAFALRGGSSTPLQQQLEEQQPKQLSKLRSLWSSKTKVIDSNGNESCRNLTADTQGDSMAIKGENESTQRTNNIVDREPKEDVVSGFLYDKLQKEVIGLRKMCIAKESGINAKDEEIKMLMKKVEGLTKSLEVETKKAKIEKEKSMTIMAKVDVKKKNSSRSKF